MDPYFTLDPNSTPVTPEGSSPASDKKEASTPVQMLPEPSLSPADDRSRLLTEMAQRDLDAALQLLAERAQYITGASGAAIALHEGGKMICRASAGPSAPELGAQLQVSSGLSGESVRGKKTLRCDDAETDLRVNRESCRALGIASVMVMPLIREREINGIFELFSGRAYAFEERDVAALERIAEMIQTAVEHAEAAKRAEKEIAGEKDEPDTALSTIVEAEAATKPDLRVEVQSAPAGENSSPAAAGTKTAPEAIAPHKPLAAEDSKPQPLTGPAKIGKCEACGFPVSAGRKLCVDCETVQIAGTTSLAGPARSEAPAFLAQVTESNQESWLRSHQYLIGTVLVAGMTVMLLLWFR